MSAKTVALVQVTANAVDKPLDLQAGGDREANHEAIEILNRNYIDNLETVLRARMDHSKELTDAFATRSAHKHWVPHMF